MMLFLVCGHIVIKSYNSIRCVNFVLQQSLAISVQNGSTAEDCPLHRNRNHGVRTFCQSQFQTIWTELLAPMHCIHFCFIHFIIQNELKTYIKSAMRVVVTLTHTHTPHRHRYGLTNSLHCVTHWTPTQTTKGRDTVARWCIFPIELT